MRVLIANEPRSYRDVIVAAFDALRPDVEVIAIEPDTLDQQIDRLNPDLVVCSRLTAAVEQRLRSWILLYPDGESKSVISIHGRRHVSDAVELEALIDAIG